MIHCSLRETQSAAGESCRGTAAGWPGNPVARPAELGHGWAALLLGIAVLLAYADSFRAGLIYDNAVLFSQDPRIHAVTAHNLSLILSGGYWYNRPDTGLYRPLTTLSFLLNYAAFGPQPASYHWVNLAMHEINVLLVYALGMLVFARRWPAFALAAIWGLHPLHTEAVTNVVGRADLLAGFGVLAGFLCYIRYSRATGRRRLAWLAGLAAAQTIGIFSKESAAVLPGIMLLYGSMTEQAGWWRQRALPYAAVVLPLAAYLWLRSSLRIHLLPSYIDNPIVAAGFLAGRMTAFEVLGKFVWLFLWPARLSADYSYLAIPVLAWQTIGWGDVLALLTAAILAAVTWFAVARKRSAKALYFFALFFWIAYLPTSNLPIVIGSIMAERFLYLPSIGLAGLAVAAAVRWRGQSRLHLPERVWWGVPAAVCIALGARTYARNLDWRDERSLWTSAVAVSPGSARAHDILGTALPSNRTACLKSPASSKLPCVFYRMTPRRTTTWATRWRICRAACRTPSPSSKRLCASGRTMPKRATAWAVRCSISPGRLARRHRGVSGGLAHPPGLRRRALQPGNCAA